MISYLWGSHIWVSPLTPSGSFEDTYVCWREGSLSKVISKQAWGPEFDPRIHLRARCSMYVYVISVLGQCRQEESEALLAGQSRQIFKSSSSRFSEKHCLKKIRMWEMAQIGNALCSTSLTTPRTHSGRRVPTPKRWLLTSHTCCGRCMPVYTC